MGPRDEIVRALADAGSLRALGARWGVSAGQLSQVISGKRQPGRKLLAALLGERRICGVIVLVSGATRTFARYLGNPNFGVLKTPANGNAVATIVKTRHPWACDNACFSRFDETKYRRMLGAVAAADKTNLLWVAAPDVVGDHDATLARFAEWHPTLVDLRLPIAFVGQDGASAGDVPWDEVACLFLGGSTAWKLGAAAESLAREAKARGKLVHMGRVNSAKRMRHAWEIGCDSVDGQSYSAWPDRYFPKAARDLEALRRQPVLF